MTNQITENTLSIEEVQVAFARSYGGLVGQLTLQNLGLEKQVQSLRQLCSDAEEVAFGLKQDNANLIKNQIAHEDEIHRLEAEIAALIEAGPTADQIAMQAKAIIDGVAKEKAAPIEAA